MVQRQMVVVSSESNAHELIGVFREREYIHGKIGNAASIQCQDLNTTKGFIIMSSTIVRHAMALLALILTLDHYCNICLAHCHGWVYKIIANMTFNKSDSSR